MKASSKKTTKAKIIADLIFFICISFVLRIMI
ncbi:MAG: hypothetical protein H6Q49_1840, partial [Deltaproteobacteria bacterium]|nr:hypothetical protein [Deltaproteobacteria bacterium]